MFWEKIAKTWGGLISRIVTPRGGEGGAAAGGAVATDAKVVGDDAHDDMQPTPYSPDYHNERSESSLHLSC